MLSTYEYKNIIFNFQRYSSAVIGNLVTGKKFLLEICRDVKSSAVELISYVLFT